MKIKVVYGVDMRLWRFKTTDSNPLPSYKDLLSYVTTTFELTDNKFRITFKDDDNEQITMTSQEDFHDAFTDAQKANKKSLKLYIINPSFKYEQKESEPPIQSTVNNNQNEGSKPILSEPTQEQINAFLNDDLTIDLLSDLFTSVFEALQASNYEISFIECIKGVILSSNNKYNKLTESEIWPYFMDILLPNISYKIETFMIPMIKMHGIDANIIKQWIPKLFYMMKQQQFAPFCGKFGRRHHRGHHRGRHRHGHGHRHHRGGRHRGGWRGRGRHGHGHGHYGHHHSHGHGHGHGFGHGFQPNYGNRIEDDEMEKEMFSYTEELVQIMNMGFTNMNEIKGLLNEHKGNKQLVVQELVLKQNK